MKLFGEAFNERNYDSKIAQSCKQKGFTNVPKSVRKQVAAAVVAVRKKKNSHKYFSVELIFRKRNYLDSLEE